MKAADQIVDVDLDVDLDVDESPPHQSSLRNGERS